MKTKPIAPIAAVTPQQAMGKAMARGVIAESGKLLQKKLLKQFDEYQIAPKLDHKK